MTDTGDTPLDCSLEPAARIEAVLMTTDRSISDRKLADAAGLDGPSVVGELIASLNEVYESTNRVFRVVRVASGWQVMTIPDAAPVLTRLLDQRKQSNLTPAAMETLSIIAYRQPVLRAEIEAIRGVACGEVLRGLLDRRLVRIAGRAEEVGRPILYGTSREFLQLFGLAGIDDLPEVDGLQRASSYSKPKPSAAESDETETPAEPQESDGNDGDSRETEAAAT
jgi:segregation and condensation protein B